jgi:hypothetical protein
LLFLSCLRRYPTQYMREVYPSYAQKRASDTLIMRASVPWICVENVWDPQLLNRFSKPHKRQIGAHLSQVDTYEGSTPAPPWKSNGLGGRVRRQGLIRSQQNGSLRR